MRSNEAEAFDTESEEMETYNAPAQEETVNLSEDELKRYVKFRRTGV
ncbi:transcription initiation factor TFIID 28kda subunit [Nematocida parisii ERTm3]|uniref:Transcription initiation factor TFIID 28kda subunit n=1 Tax=Nematocida parisii (strain ERTm3) TaxID=935791 RepID=I3EK70_NEMP3|nr:transcription initiation factor TFIID 28kda subunit [Nematocida parisii ERTm3]